MGVRSHDGVHVVALGVDLDDHSRQDMRGSIEKYSTTAGDRWRVRYELPPGPDGERRQRTKRGFLRQRDAERALREAIGSGYRRDGRSAGSHARGYR
jgi:hypothetical protein